MVTGTTTPSGIGSGTEVLISARMRNLTRGAFRQIRKDLRATASASNVFNSGLSIVNGTLNTMRTLVLATTAGVAGLAAAFATSQIRAAGHAKQIQNIADTYGVTTVEVQALTNIVRRAGIEGANVRDLFEGVTDALIKVRAGGENIEKALALTGITRGQFLNADFVQRLELIANGLESIEDPGLRAAVAADLAEDSFQRYNSVLSRIARGSLPTVIRQEVELTGEVLPSQNRRLTENQVAWRLLADRFLTFRQNVATQFAPAANFILRMLREWVDEIEGPVTDAVAKINNTLVKFFAGVAIDEELAFALGIDPTEKSPAEVFLDTMREEFDKIISDFSATAQPLVDYLDSYFLGLGTDTDIPIAPDFEPVVERRTLRTQLGTIVSGIWDTFVALFSEDTPERRAAQEAFYEAVRAMLEYTLVLLVRRLSDPGFWASVIDIIWDTFIISVTAQNEIQERSDTFANKLQSAIELLFSLAAGILIGRKLNLGPLGKVIIAAVINTILTSFGEDEDGQRSVADAILGWLTAAFLLITFGGIASSLVKRMIAAWVVAITVQETVASSRLAGRLRKIWAAAMLFLFPEGQIIASVSNMVKRMFISIAAAITASKGYLLIVAGLRRIMVLVFGQMFVESLAGMSIKQMVKRMFLAIATAIRTGNFVGIIVAALRFVLFAALATLFLAGAIPIVIVLMVARMMGQIAQAIYNSRGALLIAKALRAVFQIAFALLFVGALLPFFIVFMVARMVGQIALAISQSRGAILIGRALRGIFQLAFALLFVTGAIPVFITLMVARMMFQIVVAIGKSGGAALIGRALFNVFKIAFGLIFIVGIVPPFILLAIGVMFAQVVYAIVTSTAAVAIATAICGVFAAAWAQAVRLAKFIASIGLAIKETVAQIIFHLKLIRHQTNIKNALAQVLRKAFIGLAKGVFAAIIILAIATFIVWLIFEIAQAIGLADSNPIESAIAFVFRNILTDPGKIGAVIIAAWKYIGQTIIYAIGTAVQEVLNAIIDGINEVILAYQSLPSAFRVLGDIGTINRIDLGLTKPQRPRVGLDDQVYYAPRQVNPPPNYNPTGNPNDYGPQPVQTAVPGTIIIDGTSVRAIFTDWAYNEGLGTP